MEISTEISGGITKKEEKAVSEQTPTKTSPAPIKMTGTQRSWPHNTDQAGKISGNPT